MFRPLNGYDSIGIILASFVFATLSWKYIEQPFRGKGLLLPDRRRLFALSGVVMLVASGIGGVIHLRGGMPRRFDRYYPKMNATLLKTIQNPVWNKHGEWEKITEKIGDGVIPPIVGVKNSTPSFVLVGDSHARAIIPAMELLAQNNNSAGFIITKSSTPFLLGISKISSENDDLFDEAAHNKAVLTFIKNHPKIKTVILTSRWGAYIHGHWTAKNEDSSSESKWQDAYGQYDANLSKEMLLGIGLKRTVNAILALHLNVVLVSDVPEIGYDVPRLYMVSTRFPMRVNSDAYRPTTAEYNERQREVQQMFIELAKLPNVTVIHPESRMFDENGRGRIMANDELLYNDDDHLSTAGALYVAPVFDEVFKEMARAQ